MPKKIIININAQTESQKTFIVDCHQATANTITEMFVRGDYLAAPDKVNLTDKNASEEERKETME